MITICGCCGIQIRAGLADISVHFLGLTLKMGIDVISYKQDLVIIKCFAQIRDMFNESYYVYFEKIYYILRIEIYLK